MDEILRRIGLTEYETKVYLTLFKKGVMTGGEVSKLSGVPHGRTYEVLSNLAEKGFVSVTPVKPKLFKAVDPKIAIEHLINEKIEELNEIKNKIPEELEKVKKNRIVKKITGEKLTALMGRRNTLPIIHHFYRTAKKSVKIMFTYEFLPHSTIRLQNEAIARGVKIKHIATKMTEKGLKLMKDAVKRRIKVRYYPVHELRLFIKDGKESAQQIVNPKDSLDRTTIMIESKELTKALEDYFDSVWEKAKPIK